MTGVRRRSTVVLLTIAATWFCGCGSSSTSSSTPAASQPPTPVTPTTTTDTTASTASTPTNSGVSPDYAGLGSQRSAFEGANAQAPPNPAGAPAGLAWYTVQSTDSSGRVNSFEMTENAKPAMDDRTRLGLVEGILLPDDATQTSLNSDTCDVWKSRKLKRLIGMEYAAATTTTGTTTADMRAESSPAC
jgi:hypothetical protein